MPQETTTMTINATSGSLIYNGVSTTSAIAKSAPNKLSDDVPQGRDPAAFAGAMARNYVETAEATLAGLNNSIANYNRYNSEEFRERAKEVANSDEFLASVERTRAMYGDEAAERRMATQDPAWIMALTERQMKGSEMALQGLFDISGSLYSRNSETGMYTAGKFSLSADAGYFAVRVDSETGPEISILGGSFTSDFVRNYVPDREHLPYRIDDKQLFNIIA